MKVVNELKSKSTKIVKEYIMKAGNLLSKLKVKTKSIVKSDKFKIKVRRGVCLNAARTIMTLMLFNLPSCHTNTYGEKNADNADMSMQGRDVQISNVIEPNEIEYIDEEIELGL